MTASSKKSDQTVGSRLDEVRRRKGLSQEKFCEILGVSRSSLHKYVSDERDVPLSVLSILLEQFGIDPVWIMYGDESDIAMRRKADILTDIREIGLAVERRADELGIALTADERWRVVSQIYTAAIMQGAAYDRERATRDFVVDSMLSNNGHR